MFLISFLEWNSNKSETVISCWRVPVYGDSSCVCLWICQVDLSQILHDWECLGIFAQHEFVSFQCWLLLATEQKWRSHPNTNNPRNSNFRYSLAKERYFYCRWENIFARIESLQTTIADAFRGLVIQRFHKCSGWRLFLCDWGGRKGQWDPVLPQACLGRAGEKRPASDEE